MDINCLSLEETTTTSKNGEIKTHKSRFNNTFKCLICNSEFRCRSHLKNHIMRTEKCGTVTNDDMIDDMIDMINELFQLNIQLLQLPFN
jgi:transcription elongation factor Elf1